MADVKTMNNINILNAVRNRMSVDYRSRVPEATQGNINTIYDTILDPYNPMARDELVPALVELIASQSISTESFRNPLRFLNSNAMPYGNGEQEIFVNMATGTPHNPKITIEEATDIYDSYIMALYHKINFNNDYRVTIYFEDLRTAFLDNYGLRNLISAKVESIVSGCNMDEFVTAKELISAAYAAGCVYPVHVPAVTDKASAEAALVEIQNYIDASKIPNPNFNYAGATSAAKDDTLLLFTDTRTHAQFNVYSYSGAYNLEMMIPKAQQIVVDNFNDSEDIVAVLVDKRFFKIREQYRLMVRDAVNAGLRWNETYTVKEMFSYSLFYPIFVFTSADVGITSINPTAINDAVVGTDRELQFTITAADVASKGVDFEVSGNSSKDTFVIPGTHTLRIARDETGLTAGVTVKITSRVDPSKTANLVVKKSPL